MLRAAKTLEERLSIVHLIPIILFKLQQMLTDSRLINKNITKFNRSTGSKQSFIRLAQGQLYLGIQGFLKEYQPETR